MLSLTAKPNPLLSLYLTTVSGLFEEPQKILNHDLNCIQNMTWFVRSLGYLVFQMNGSNPNGERNFSFDLEEILFSQRTNLKTLLTNIYPINKMLLLISQRHRMFKLHPLVTSQYYYHLPGFCVLPHKNPFTHSEIVKFNMLDFEQSDLLKAHGNRYSPEKFPISSFRMYSTILAAFFNRLRFASTYQKFFDQRTKRVFKWVSKNQKSFSYLIVSLEFRFDHYLKMEKGLKTALKNLNSDLRKSLNYDLADRDQNKGFWMGLTLLLFLRDFVTVKVEVKCQISELKRHLDKIDKGLLEEQKKERIKSVSEKSIGRDGSGTIHDNFCIMY